MNEVQGVKPIPFEPNYEVHKCPVCSGFGTVSYQKKQCHACQGKGWLKIWRGGK